MPKDQAHFRLEKGLLQALKDRAQEENMTTTELVTRLLKQGLGIESPTYQELDISQIEERILNRISQQQEQWAKDLENRIFDRVSDLIPVVDVAAIEARLSNHVSEYMPKVFGEYLAVQEPKLPIATNDAVQPAEHDSGVGQSTPETSQQAQEEELSVIPGNEAVAQKSATSLGTLPLFNSIEKGEIVKPSQLVEYLNTQVIRPNSKKWDILQLRYLKNRHLNYRKKSISERKGEPELPKVINGHLIDWVFSEKETTKGSVGKQWWIQRLPTDPTEAEKLITARREKWDNLP